MRISGVYGIQNKINNKLYVGSSVNIPKRKIAHYGDLRRHTHRNDKLQRAFNKYGESNFSFDIIEVVDEESKLIDSEQKWIDFFKPEYNIIPYADRRTFSEEHKRNLSISHIGNKHTEESKRKIGIASKGNKYRMGKKISEKQKDAIRNAKIGKRGRRGPDNPLYGKKRNPEHMAKAVATRMKNKIPKPNCHCGQPFHAKGFCKYHYKKNHRKKK